MNKILFFGAALLLMFASCSKDDDPAAYYVKYEVTFKTQKTGIRVEAYFNTEKSVETMISQTQSNNFFWEGTYGPVEKGFLTNLACSTIEEDMYGRMKVYEGEIQARIYVSRDKEPFVIKADQIGVGSVSLNYKIDF